MPPDILGEEDTVHCLELQSQCLLRKPQKPSFLSRRADLLLIPL